MALVSLLMACSATEDVERIFSDDSVSFRCCHYSRISSRTGLSPIGVASPTVAGNSHINSPLYPKRKPKRGFRTCT